MLFHKLLTWCMKSLSVKSENETLKNLPRLLTLSLPKFLHIKFIKVIKTEIEFTNEVI